MSLTLWQIWCGGAPQDDGVLYESATGARVEAENAHRITRSTHPLTEQYKWDSAYRSGVHVLLHENPDPVFGPRWEETGYTLHPERETQ